MEQTHQKKLRKQKGYIQRVSVTWGLYNRIKALKQKFEIMRIKFNNIWESSDVQENTSMVY